ncbi:MAG: MBL fold metallo-hydrolase [Oscillatoriales cyanobacterium]|nr:MAG: MBL fold metallo-hydrolase [Oscillatoriales cyanobacterium]
MIFRQLFDLATWTYTYLIGDRQSGQAVLVDPVLEQADRDLALIDELGLQLVYSLETHVHADHITSGGLLRERTGCTSIVPLSANVACADRQIRDGETIAIGETTIVAIETHGHTDSHMAFLVNQTHLLTGDSLFIRGCGRTDFQSGNPGTLYDCVTTRLFTLPDETLVYPGHDYRGHSVSTIGEEKQYNPRFVGKDRAAFIDMNALDLPNPQKIMEAVPANERCGQKSV